MLFSRKACLSRLKSSSFSMSNVHTLFIESVCFHFPACYSDEDFCSSSSDSRESSAGRSVRPTGRHKLRIETMNKYGASGGLKDISLRDSGLSSGDPSPNMGHRSEDGLARRPYPVNRSSSSSSLDHILRMPRSGEYYLTCPLGTWCIYLEVR